VMHNFFKEGPESPWSWNSAPDADCALRIKNQTRCQDKRQGARHTVHNRY
jgi:hypothetical protein